MTDLDSDLRNRAVNFSIENGDHLHMFDIEKSEGNIIVQTPLDRETVSRICVQGSLMIPLLVTFEPPREKTNNVVSEQVRHKPACTSTEKSYKLEISDLSRRGIVLSE